MTISLYFFLYMIKLNYYALYRNHLELVYEIQSLVHIALFKTPITHGRLFPYAAYTPNLRVACGLGMLVRGDNIHNMPFGIVTKSSHAASNQNIISRSVMLSHTFSPEKVCAKSSRCLGYFHHLFFFLLYHKVIISV
jgi:hypothetical protein